MALVAFLRGVNVGGHKTFRPSVLARELSAFDVVNVGAAGTFVVRKPKGRAQFLDALLERLPFDAQVLLCEGRDVRRLATESQFAAEPSQTDLVRFVSILPSTGHARPRMPIMLPPEGEWLVRVIEVRGRFVLGVYRRHMKTIGCLGQLDRLFGMRATTRNWNTIAAVVRVLESNNLE